MRVLLPTFLVLASALTIAPASAEDYTVATVKVAPPSSLSRSVLDALNPVAYRIVDKAGKPFADLWLRKAVPASEPPSGAKGRILFPFLADGELLGVLRYASEGRDYRDQSIPKGVYTIRYGIQPLGGGHKGVSVHRDYLLILPADQDTELADMPKRTLINTSALTAGANHPACLLLLDPADSVDAAPAMVHDRVNAVWGAVLPLNLKVEKSSELVVKPIEVIVVGVFLG